MVLSQGREGHLVLHRYESALDLIRNLAMDIIVTDTAGGVSWDFHTMEITWPKMLAAWD